MKNAKDKIIDAIVWIIAIISAAWWLWMIVSYFDIVTHNIESYSGYGEYLEWNFFTVMRDLIRG